MFYQGSLQDGISAAVGQQKVVLCFVTNDNETSQTWENEFLQDSSLVDLIKDKAVALRLEAGSDEAGYLDQIFPLPQTPTVVIMKHGELKEYLTPTTTKEDFLRRVQNAFSAQPPSAPTAAQPEASSTTTASSNHTSSSHPDSSSRPSSSSATAAEAASQQQSDNVRRILSERAQRSQAEKEEAEQKAKEERMNASKGKGKANADGEPDSAPAQAHHQAELVRKQKQQAQEERRRILKRIEDDKAERRLQAARKEKQRAEAQNTADPTSSMNDSPLTKIPSSAGAGGIASLQVRLFDGSTIRSRFKSESSLRDTRKWIDESRTDGKDPYTFKHVLTPQPNKTIDETEEEKSLKSLGLAPSATLILLPVAKYSSAYDGAGSGNVISQLFGLIFGFFTWLLSLIGLGGRRRGASEPSRNENGSGSENNAAPDQALRSRIQGFENPGDRRRDQQLYNGNSLNFEPRPDEDKSS